MKRRVTGAQSEQIKFFEDRHVFRFFINVM